LLKAEEGERRHLSNHEGYWARKSNAVRAMVARGGLLICEAQWVNRK
jgi:hypothetical protein